MHRLCGAPAALPPTPQYLESRRQALELMAGGSLEDR